METVDAFQAARAAITDAFPDRAHALRIALDRHFPWVGVVCPVCGRGCPLLDGVVAPMTEGRTPARDSIEFRTSILHAGWTNSGPPRTIRVTLCGVCIDEAGVRLGLCPAIPSADQVLADVTRAVRESGDAHGEEIVAGVERGLARPAPASWARRETPADCTVCIRTTPESAAAASLLHATSYVLPDSPWILCESCVRVALDARTR